MKVSPTHSYFKFLFLLNFLLTFFIIKSMRIRSNINKLNIFPKNKTDLNSLPNFNFAQNYILNFFNILINNNRSNETLSYSNNSIGISEINNFFEEKKIISQNKIAYTKICSSHNCNDPFGTCVSHNECKCNFEYIL